MLSLSRSLPTRPGNGDGGSNTSRGTLIGFFNRVLVINTSFFNLLDDAINKSLHAKTHLLLLRIAPITSFLGHADVLFG